MKYTLPALLALALTMHAVRAHEGHDHGAPAVAMTAGAGSPRASAQSPDLEAVAVLEGAAPGGPAGAKLTLYLDRFASNEPLVEALVEIESGAFKATASRVAPGVFTAAAGDLARPGRHALTLVVQAGDLSDLLSLTLDVAPAQAAPEAAPAGWIAPLKAAGATAAALLLAAAAWIAMRRRRRAAAERSGLAAGVVLIAGLALIPGDALAHGGEDHSHDAGKAATGASRSVATVVGDATAARRLPDGSVFMPKAMQYQLGVRHLLAKPGDHPATIEFSGRVVADPHTSGRVQATQSGRIEAGPQGLPTIGQQVVKGQVLAALRPSAGAIERGNQEALRSELEAQRAIAERRLVRLEQLEGAVPQKDIEAARIELGALQRRSQAVGGALAGTEALLAPVSGVVSAVHVLAGQVVEAREVLFDLVDPSRLAVEALAYEPVNSSDLTAASAEVGGRDLPLRFVGAGRQLREQAMPLLFALRSPDAVLAVGQPLKVIARTARRTQGVALPRSAVVRLASGELGVWVHAEAERFTPRRVTTQALDGARLVVTAGVGPGERIVTEGASLLAQVR